MSLKPENVQQQQNRNLWLLQFRLAGIMGGISVNLPHKSTLAARNKTKYQVKSFIILAVLRRSV